VASWEAVTLPLALAELGLIDEYEFVVQPTLAGHGPTLFAGLSKRVGPGRREPICRGAIRRTKPAIAVSKSGSDRAASIASCNGSRRISASARRSI
jgi:hypothetical protein